MISPSQREAGGLIKATVGVDDTWVMIIPTMQRGGGKITSEERVLLLAASLSQLQHVKSKSSVCVVHMQTATYVRTHTRTRTRAHARAHARTRVHMHAHTHTHAATGSLT